MTGSAVGWGPVPCHGDCGKFNLAQIARQSCNRLQDQPPVSGALPTNTDIGSITQWDTVAFIKGVVAWPPQHLHFYQ